MSEMYEQAAQNGFWLVEDETIASKRMMLEAQIEVKMEFCFCNISPNFRRSRKHSKLWMSWTSFQIEQFIASWFGDRIFVDILNLKSQNVHIYNP